MARAGETSRSGSTSGQGGNEPMSAKLVGLVLKAQLPKNMQRRAPAKLVLVQLADVCQNDEGVECFPSRATMARACERTERTVDAILADLAERDLITETDKPRRHRPRTWRLNVSALLDLQPVATLKHSEESQPVASLDKPRRTPDTQIQTVDLQSRSVDSQLSRLESQHVATERNELFLNIENGAAQAPRGVLSDVERQKLCAELKAIAERAVMADPEASFEAHCKVVQEQSKCSDASIVAGEVTFARCRSTRRWSASARLAEKFSLRRKSSIAACRSEATVRWTEDVGSN